MGRKESGRRKKGKMNTANQKDRLLLKMTTLSLTGFRICRDDKNTTVGSVLLPKDINTGNLY